MTDTDVIRKHYWEDKVENILHKSKGIVFIILIIISYFIFSDFYVRNVPVGFWIYYRILPIAISIIFLGISFTTLWQKKQLMLYTYYTLLSSLLVMMLGISARTYQTELFVSSVFGIIIITFGVLLLARSGIKTLIPIYIIPVLLFVIFHLVFDTNITPKELADYSNPAVFMIGALIVAEIQERLRYKEFSLKYTLKEEKIRSEKLYQEVLSKTQSLEKANTELESKRIKIELQRNMLIDQNKKLINSERELKNSLQTKDKLFSVIAHDLRSPFTALVGLTKILTQNITKLESSKIVEQGDQIHESSKKLLTLIENLLYWSRSQTGNLTLFPERISLGQIVTDAISLYSDQARSKEIKFINETGLNHVAFADFETISTVVRNLISNALKFSHTNGVVTINANKEGGNTMLIISDTGVGISPEKLNEIFNIEKSAPTKGTNQEHGTGLGLLICKEFIEKNKGEIWVDSTEGEGTTFTVSLPTY